MPITIAPGKDDPCSKELMHYTECVKRHPAGLRETDCEDVKMDFKACMKTWKTREKSAGQEPKVDNSG
jgi:hypothetical protein